MNPPVRYKLLLRELIIVLVRKSSVLGRHIFCALFKESLALYAAARQLFSISPSQVTDRGTAFTLLSCYAVHVTVISYPPSQRNVPAEGGPQPTATEA